MFFLVFSSALIFGLISAEEKVATNEPKFLSQGGDRRVREGSSLDLECEVNDLGEFVLLWKFNRTNVLFAGNLRIHRDERISRNNSNGALIIRDFRPENAGEYSCQVSTNPPQDIIYQVSLLGPPLIGQTDNQEVMVKKFESVQLMCETKAPKVEWRKDDRLVGSEPLLVMERVQPKDSGIYQCIASNEMGQTTREFHLKVLFAPQLKAAKSLVNAPIGQQIIIECLVSAEPSANVNWFRSGNRKVLPSDKFIIDRNDSVASLALISIKEEDFDQYSCQANNSMGSAVQTIHVTGRPSIPLFTTDPLAGRQNSYTIGWNVESESPIKKYVIQWKSREEDNWKSQQLEDEDLPREFRFEMTSLEEDNNYDVTVEAHNQWGSTKSHVFAFVTSFASQAFVSSLVLALTLALSVQNISIN